MSRQSELKKASRTIGTCPDMCPEKERLQREAQHQISLFEQGRFNGTGRMDHTIAVKQYSRSSADQESPLPHDLRPVKTLEITMSYLLHKIMDLCETPDVNIGEWFHFLWDRTRGIRKDITQQELCCQGSVRLVEQCARFHIHCSARLVAEDAAVFDQRINTENLTKCLQTLKYMYADLALQGVRCQNEAEFRGYIVLLNLNDGNFMWELQQLSPDVQRSSEVHFALQVHSALDKNNYVRFFKLVKETSYLNACILLRYFIQVRVKALLVILKSCVPRHPLTNFPLSELSNALGFEDEVSAVDFLEYYGLPFTDDGAYVILDRKSFCQPDVPYQPDRAIRLVESKRRCTIGEVVHGSSPQNFEPIQPQCSFDVDGHLKLSKVPREWRSKYTSIRNVLVSDASDTPETPTVSPVKPEVESPIAQKFTFCLPSSIEMKIPPVSVPSMGVFRFQAPKEMSPPRDEPDRAPVVEKTEMLAPVFSFKSNFKTPPIIPVEPLVPIAIRSPPPQPKIPVMPPSPIVPTTKIVFKPKPKEIPVITTSEPVIRPVLKRTRSETELKTEKKITIPAPKPTPINKEQELLKARLLKREVAQVLTDVVSKVVRNVHEEIERGKKLTLICQKIKARKLLMYIDKWKSIIQTKKRERDSFLNNPVWVSMRSPREEAQQLHTTSQDISMEDMKQYVTGTRSFSPESDHFKPVPKLNVPQLIWKTLFEKLSTRHPNVDIFWKVTFVIDTRNHYTAKYLNHLLNNAFCLTNNVAIESCRTQIGTKFTYCVAKTNESSDCNGLCYVTDYDTYSPVILSRFDKKRPVLVVVCNGPKITTKNLPVEVVHLGGHVTVPVLIASLKWLAERVLPPPSLQMNTLPALIQAGAGQELLDRVHRSLTINIRLEIALRNPNTAINLYNNGIKKLEKLFSNFDTVDFPEEFKKYLNVTDVLIPCTYEYFPKGWRDGQARISETLLSFLLRKWDAPWPPSDAEELYFALQTYLDDDRTFAEILKTLSHVFSAPEDEFEDRVKTISWCNILSVVSSEKLRKMVENEPIYCVYKTEDLERLRVEPWWYDCVDFMKKLEVIPPEEINMSIQSDWVDSGSETEIDVDTTILEASEALTKFNEKRDDDLRNELLELNAMFDDLEESLNIQKKIVTKFKETANSTLHNI